METDRGSNPNSSLLLKMAGKPPPKPKSLQGFPWTLSSAKRLSLPQDSSLSGHSSGVPLLHKVGPDWGTGAGEAGSAALWAPPGRPYHGDLSLAQGQVSGTRDGATEPRERRTTQRLAWGAATGVKVGVSVERHGEGSVGGGVKGQDWGED